MYIYLIFITCFLCIVYIHNKRKYKRFWKLLDEFYSEPALPLIGNAHQFGSLTAGSDFLWITNALSVKAGHSTYKFQVGKDVLLGFCEPETIEIMLSNNKETFKLHDYKDLFEPWLGDGLLISSGDKWRQRRKIITPTFHFKILEQFVKVFNDNGDILIEELKKEKGTVFDIYPYVNRCALDIICEAAMGTSINAQTDLDSEYVNAVHSACKLLITRFTSPWKRISWLYKLSNDYICYKKYCKIMHKFTDSVIETRKERLHDEIEKVRIAESNLNNQDEFIKTRNKITFLDLLLLSKLPDGSFLSHEDVREEVDTFMFEGHDTTTSAISFAIYELANNPDIQEKVLEEVLQVIGHPKSPITYEHLQNLKYTELVIKEVLRLYPSVPHYGRQTANDLELPDGRTVPGGCIIMIDVFSLGRNPRCYENHEKFIPERFSLDNMTGKNPFIFASFSAGPRNCIGQKFALLEMKTFLAKLLMNYELIASDIKVKLVQEVILKSTNGINVIIKERVHK